MRTAESPVNHRRLPPSLCCTLFVSQYQNISGRALFVSRESPAFLKVYVAASLWVVKRLVNRTMGYLKKFSNNFCLPEVLC